MSPAASAPWTPQLGAWPADGGFRFRVWAPERHRVEIDMAVEHPRREGGMVAFRPHRWRIFAR